MTKRRLCAITALISFGVTLTGCASVGDTVSCEFPRDGQPYLTVLPPYSVEFTEGPSGGISLPADLSTVPLFHGTLSSTSTFVYVDIERDGSGSIELKEFTDPTDLVRALCGRYETTSGGHTLQLSVAYPLFTVTDDGTWARLPTPAEKAGHFPATAVGEAIDDAEYSPAGTGVVVAASSHE